MSGSKFSTTQWSAPVEALLANLCGPSRQKIKKGTYIILLEIFQNVVVGVSRPVIAAHAQLKRAVEIMLLLACLEHTIAVAHNVDSCTAVSRESVVAV